MELRMPRNFDLETFNPHGISAYTDPSGKSTSLSNIAPQVLQQFHIVMQLGLHSRRHACILSGEL